MQIHRNGLTLFDYLSDPSKGDDMLKQLAQGASTTNNIGKELGRLNDTLSLGEASDPLNVLSSDLHGVSLNTVNNMLTFNLRPVAGDLQNVAAQLGINQPVQIQQQSDGKWTVRATDGDTDSDTAKTDGDADNTTQKAQANSPQALQQLQQYLDHNTQLQTKLTQLDRLSEFYQFGSVQQFAKSLPASGVSQDNVVSFLTASRSQIKQLGSFTLSAKGGLQLNADNSAEHIIAAAKKQFNMNDSSTQAQSSQG